MERFESGRSSCAYFSTERIHSISINKRTGAPFLRGSPVLLLFIQYYHFHISWACVQVLEPRNAGLTEGSRLVCQAGQPPLVSPHYKLRTILQTFSSSAQTIAILHTGKPPFHHVMEGLARSAITLARSVQWARSRSARFHLFAGIHFDIILASCSGSAISNTILSNSCPIRSRITTLPVS